MKHMLTDNEPSPFQDFNSLEKEEIDLDVSNVSNAYEKWANDIYEKCLNQLIDNGDRANAHFNPALIKRLMRDIKWFPL